MLVGLDALALLIAWGLSLLLPGISGTDFRGRLLPAIGISLIVTVASLFFASSQRLYLARVCVVRAEEKARLARVALFTFVAGLLACQLVNFDVSYLRLAVATVLTFLVMAGFRLGYHQYLRVSRARGALRPADPPGRCQRRGGRAVAAPRHPPRDRHADGRGGR